MQLSIILEEQIEAGMESQVLEFIPFYKVKELDSNWYETKGSDYNLHIKFKGYDVTFEYNLHYGTTSIIIT